MHCWPEFLCIYGIDTCFWSISRLCGGSISDLYGDPFKALMFIVLFLVLQQIEGDLIYPHVVGISVASVDLGAGSGQYWRKSDGSCRNADIYSD